MKKIEKQFNLINNNQLFIEKIPFVYDRIKGVLGKNIISLTDTYLKKY